MASYAAHGVVLHRNQLGETDRVVTLLSRERGKVAAVAKGSRRPGGKLTGATELFTYGRFLLAEGRNLDIITQCEVIEGFTDLRGDLDLLARAAYVCELADHMLDERQPSPATLDLVLWALHVLAAGPRRPDVLVHAFEMRLLRDRGYGLELRQCVRCGAQGQGGSAWVSPQLGGRICGQCRRAATDGATMTGAALDLMAGLLLWDAVLVGHAEPAAAEMGAVERMLRWAIRHRTDREMRSSGFLEMVRHGVVDS